jgi:membrane-bound lytic murein transglycosylase D
MNPSYRLHLLIIISTLPYLSIQGQAIDVPDKVSFANMVLHIKPEAKEEIQKKVSSLTQSPTHYKEISERVNLYMPFIEKVLKEEGVPEDFKYLVIQESVLVPDEVSTSNAVGFWQFKQETGLEVNLRIDHDIDERMHIIASTRGFCKFVKSHHNHFQNWLYALLAHYLGRTGTKNFIAENQWHINGTHVTIDKKVHWYIYHFIAHKIAFESAHNNNPHPSLRLYEYHNCHGKTLHEISSYFNVPLATMQAYNPWIKPLSVPLDIRYPLLIPMAHDQYARIQGKIDELLEKHYLNYETYLDSAKIFPIIHQSPSAGSNQEAITLINGLKGIVVKGDTSLVSLAKTGKITLEQFLAYNEIDSLHKPMERQVYYFEPKNRRARAHYHIVQPKETWWTIAQQYGIKQASLLLRNRLRKPEILITGRVLWLRFIRPANIPIAYIKQPSVKTENLLQPLPIPQLPTMLTNNNLLTTPVPDETLTKEKTNEPSTLVQDSSHSKK